MKDDGRRADGSRGGRRMLSILSAPRLSKYLAHLGSVGFNEMLISQLRSLASKKKCTG